MRITIDRHTLALLQKRDALAKRSSEIAQVEQEALMDVLNMERERANARPFSSARWGFDATKEEAFLELEELPAETPPNALAAVN
ncbi:MAG TPA: hypothetical protein VNL17_14420 [Verrucomicrobiae bacterium]|nr:hypothetical protein [Verrucomicrobiae bacterium]